MGSRLKGGKRSNTSKFQEWRIGKLLVYLLLAAGLTGLLMILYYDSLDLKKSVSPGPDAGRTGAPE
jgi:hypothetical protein